MLGLGPHAATAAAVRATEAQPLPVNSQAGLQSIRFAASASPAAAVSQERTNTQTSTESSNLVKLAIKFRNRSRAQSMADQHPSSGVNPRSDRQDSDEPGPIDQHSTDASRCASATDDAPGGGAAGDSRTSSSPGPSLAPPMRRIKSTTKDPVAAAAAAALAAVAATAAADPRAKHEIAHGNMQYSLDPLWPQDPGVSTLVVEAPPGHASGRHQAEDLRFRQNPMLDSNSASFNTSPGAQSEQHVAAAAPRTGASSLRGLRCADMDPSTVHKPASRKDNALSSVLAPTIAASEEEAPH